MSTFRLILTKKFTVIGFVQRSRDVSFALKKTLTTTRRFKLFKRSRYVSGGEPGTIRDAKLNIIFRKNISAILSELDSTSHQGVLLTGQGIIPNHWNTPEGVTLVNELCAAVNALKPFNII